MTFKWTIRRPSFHAMVESVEVMRPGIDCEFETGSIGEAHGIFGDSGTALSEIFGGSIMANAAALVGEATEPAPETTKERKPRGPNKPKPEAVAPDPIAIPGAEAPPIVPPPPPAPPSPPVVPPTGVLAGKIIAEMDRRTEGGTKGGQEFADWLATSGAVTKGATYDEAVKVLRLVPDEKLGPIGTQLALA